MHLYGDVSSYVSNGLPIANAEHCYILLRSYDNNHHG